MSAEQAGTLVIGGGQAGLAMSEHLSGRGVSHLVVERHRIAERYRTLRTNSEFRTMPKFLCFFISDDDTVGSLERLELEQEEAIRRAQEMLRGRSRAVSVELWESGHFVARIPRQSEKDRT